MDRGLLRGQGDIQSVEKHRAGMMSGKLDIFKGWF